MKLILSRKGFDSQYGGVPSPIFPDRSMVSLPIPSGADSSRFSDVAFNGTNLGDIAASLTGRPIFRHAHAHHDPDLDAAARPRLPGWRAAIGQVGAAQKHLQNQRVGIGDLFLFFGWFREVVDSGDGGGWRYRRGAPDLHVLFGWLQVGEVLKLNADSAGVRAARPEFSEHPHFNGRWHDTNTVYVASDRLVIDGQDMGAPGGGAFPRFHPGLQLTKPGRTRTVWSLPGWFWPPSGPTLSYHLDQKRWERDGDRCALKTVCKGQEFVMDMVDVPEAGGWIESLLASVPVALSGLCMAE